MASDESTTGGRLVTGSAQLSMNVTIRAKAATAVASAVAAGDISIEELEQAVDVLDKAEARGDQADAALEALREASPTLVDQLREVLAKPVTWNILNFIVNLARLLLETHR